MSRDDGDSTFVRVVGESGLKVEIPVSPEEYKEILFQCDFYKGADFPYEGTNAFGKRYALMMGTSTLLIVFRGLRSVPEGTGGIGGTKLVKMKIVHQKGGEVVLVVTEAEYQRVLGRFNTNRASSFAYIGKDAAGNDYRLMLGFGIFCIDAEQHNA